MQRVTVSQDTAALVLEVAPSAALIAASGFWRLRVRRGMEELSTGSLRHDATAQQVKTALDGLRSFDSSSQNYVYLLQHRRRTCSTAVAGGTTSGYDVTINCGVDQTDEAGWIGQTVYPTLIGEAVSTSVASASVTVTTKTSQSYALDGTMTFYLGSQGPTAVRASHLTAASWSHLQAGLETISGVQVTVQKLYTSSNSVTEFAVRFLAPIGNVLS